MLENPQILHNPIFGQICVRLPKNSKENKNMENFNTELIEKAKQTKSTEELLALAKENGIELAGDEAKAYYAQLHPVSGELSDEELDNVAGGGCSVKVGGHKYTVVSSGVSCFNGCYENGMFWDNINGNYIPLKKDNEGLRKLWNSMAQVSEIGAKFCCGSCRNLEFKNGTGYCGKS